MAVSGRGSFVYIDDLTDDGSSRINVDVYRNIFSASLPRNSFKLIRRKFIRQQNNDLNQTANKRKDFIRGKKRTVLDRPSQSQDINLLEDAFQHLKRRLIEKKTAPQKLNK